MILTAVHWLEKVSGTTPGFIAAGTPTAPGPAESTTPTAHAPSPSAVNAPAAARGLIALEAQDQEEDDRRRARIDKRISFVK